MTPLIKKRLQKAAFVEKLKLQYLALAAKEAAFIASDTFLRMRQALLTNPKAVTLDSEEFSYFPERAKKAAGWEFATPDDIKLFWDIVVDPQALTVEPSTLVWTTTKNGFDSCTFQHYGLYAWLLTGQGTCLSVSNRPPSK